MRLVDDGGAAIAVDQVGGSRDADEAAGEAARMVE